MIPCIPEDKLSGLRFPLFIIDEEEAMGADDCKLSLRGPIFIGPEDDEESI